MAYRYTVGDASRYLKMDPKTFHRWCRQLGITPASSANGRVKLYSQKQLERIATHINSLNASPVLAVEGQDQHLSYTQLQTVYTHLEALEQNVRITREQVAVLLTNLRT